MDPQAVGAVIGGFGTLVGVGMAAVFRILTYVDAKDRYHEAREEILFRRIDLRDKKLHAVAADAGIMINGVFEAEDRAMVREWENLVARGKA